MEKENYTFERPTQNSLEHRSTPTQNSLEHSSTPTQNSLEYSSTPTQNSLEHSSTLQNQTSCNNPLRAVNLNGTKFQMSHKTYTHIRSVLTTKTVTVLYQGSDREEIFIERDAESFRSILRYFQNGELHMPLSLCPAVFSQELDFWGVDWRDLSNCCLRKYICFHKDVKAVQSFQAAFTPKNTISPNKLQSSWQKVRKYIWAILDDPRSSALGKIYLMMSTAFVIISVFVLSMSTIEEGQRNLTTSEMEYLQWFEFFEIYDYDYESTSFINLTEVHENQSITRLKPSTFRLPDNAVETRDVLRQRNDVLDSNTNVSLKVEEKETSGDYIPSPENIETDEVSDSGVNSHLQEIEDQITSFSDGIGNMSTGSQLLETLTKSNLSSVETLNWGMDQMKSSSDYGSMDHVVPSSDYGSIDHVDSSSDYGSIDHVESISDYGSMKHVESSSDYGSMGHVEPSSDYGSMIDNNVSASETQLGNEKEHKHRRPSVVKKFTHLMDVFGLKTWLLRLQMCVIIFFSIEYLVRLIFAPKRLRYAVSFFALLDLFCLIVMFAPAVAYKVDPRLEYKASIWKIINCFQMFRVLRLFKQVKDVPGFRILIFCIRNSYKDLLLLLLYIFLVVSTLSPIIYFLEADNMKSIPHAGWWVIVTMTTVGYGDMVPVTWPGKLVGCICAIGGILLGAITVPIFVNNYLLLYDQSKVMTLEPTDLKEKQSKLHDSIIKQVQSFH